MVEQNILQAEAFAVHWSKFITERPDVLAKIHWRSGNDGIQIISHMQEKPMNGGVFIKEPEKKSYSDVRDRLEHLLNNDLADLHKKGQREAEHKLQASFITDLLNPRSTSVAMKFLQTALGEEKLTFAGSEVVLYEKAVDSIFNQWKIVDVVMVSATKIYVVEMKTPQNKQDNPLKQGQEYLAYYDADKIKPAFCRLISCYSNRYVNTDFPMELVVLKGYMPSKEPHIEGKQPLLLHWAANTRSRF